MCILLLHPGFALKFIIEPIDTACSLSIIGEK